MTDNVASHALESARRAMEKRRTVEEARKCSQEGCPGDGRYSPPGRGHRTDCPHNAIKWVWEEIR